MSNVVPITPVQPTHVVTYKGATETCTEATYELVCESLISRLGPPTAGDYPRIKPIGAAVVPVGVADPIPARPTPAPTPIRPAVKGGAMDTVAAARITGQEDLALTAGFAPKPPLYAAGTRVIDVGVENARREQIEHDEKPLAKTLAGDLVRVVRAEDRRDVPQQAVADLRMTKAGMIVLPGGEPGRGGAMATGEPGRGERLPMDPRAFASLMGRMPCRSGIAYLNDCTPELRALNFNHWAVRLHEQEAKGKEDPALTVLRTRKVEGQRQVFAAVSPTYTSFDADQIGAALQLALPGDAKGSLEYDGQRMRLEALWRSNVAPEEFAAGEFFKAGVIVRADDTGAGSIRVQSVLWRNLCLNLIILDKAIGVDIRIRHVGSVEALAQRFREAFTQALGSLDGFRRAWGYAMKERDEVLVERIRAAHGAEVEGLSATGLLPGLFNGILEAELVKVPGRRKDVVPALLEMHRQDEAADVYGVSRASIANAFTRYAHRVNSDPFVADEIREGAGALLSGFKGRDPKPLPYAAFAA
jgi:hypothetical protein